MRCAYLNGIRPRAGTSNEVAGTCIIGIHAQPATKVCAACLLDATLDICGVVRAITGYMEAFGGAVRCPLAATGAIGRRAR